MGWLSRINTKLPLALGVAVVGAYILFVTTYAIDYPQEDDLLALVAFVLKFPEGGLASLLQRHNEHVIAWARLAAWLFTIVGGGSLSIIAMLYVGQLMLIPLYRGLKSTISGLSSTHQPWLALPILCLLFNPQYQVTALWAMALWSNILVLVFALLACRALGRDNYIPAALWAMAASLSNGNGIAIFAVGFGILALQRASIRAWLTWAVAGGLAFAALRYALSQSAAAGTQTFEVLAPSAVPMSLVAFLGSALALVGGRGDAVLTLTAGTLILAVGGYYFYKTIRETLAGKPLSPASALLLGMLAFVIASGLAVALFRAEKGLSVVAGARYRHYGCLALIIAYTMAQRLLPERYRLRLAQTTTITLLLTLALAYPRQIAYRIPLTWRVQADAYNLAYNRNFPQLIISGFDSTYAQAVQAGVLKAPPRFHLEKRAAMPSPATHVVDQKGNDRFICRERYQIANELLSPEGGLISGSYALAISRDCRDTPASPAEGRFSYAKWWVERPFSLIGMSSNPFKNGVKASLHTCGLQGRYKLGWALGQRFHTTGDTITLP